MIETPLGVLAAAEIAGASPRLAALVLGTSDLTKDLNARETRDRLPLMTALGLVLLAARALRLRGARRGPARPRRRGGVRRVLPAGARARLRRQDTDPSDADRAGQRRLRAERDEIARARRLVAAYAEGVAAGKGAIRHEGRLVEALHVEAARRTLALAEAIAARGG